MIWIKLWNSFKSLKAGEWLIIISPFTEDEIEILKEGLEYE